jgi:predicted short-subunit dehydrogenase-like oxidoreductase (DUF2520 family)
LTLRTPRHPETTANFPNTLSIIGGGRLARSLGGLWAAGGHVIIRDVLCRSMSDSCRAVADIGAGRPVTQYADLREADLFMVATPDRAIASVADQLVGAGRVTGSGVVFHCSGAETSMCLLAAQKAGAATASAHPLMTFTEQRVSAGEFAGTYCTLEGDSAACARIEALFAAIGAKTLGISTETKLLYHAAAVFASNYLVTVLQTSFEVLGMTGISHDVGRAMMTPLARRAVENALRLGPRAALTGPVARGDVEVVQRHLEALSLRDPAIADLYRMLATRTARLATVADIFPIVDRGGGE